MLFGVKATFKCSFSFPFSPPIKNQMDGLKISMRSIFLFEYKNDPMDSFII